MLAGGGIKGGISYGTTDELGYAAEENPVAVPDFHATMLHLLGIDLQAIDGQVPGSRCSPDGYRGECRDRHSGVAELDGESGLCT